MSHCKKEYLTESKIVRNSSRNRLLSNVSYNDFNLSEGKNGC
jgi:hypothetical protein